MSGRFFTKQKDGDAPAALQDQKNLDVTSLPYMRDEHFGQTIEKKGKFRETSMQTDAYEYLITGSTMDAAGAAQGVIDLGSTAIDVVGQGASFTRHFTSVTNLFFTAGVYIDFAHAESVFSRYMLYVGRNAYVYIERPQVGQIFQSAGDNVITGPVQLPIIEGATLMAPQYGQQKNPKFGAPQINDIYCSPFTFLNPPGESLNDSLSSSLTVQPLDEASSSGVLTLVVWPTYLGLTNYIGVLKSDTVYATMTKGGTLGPISVMPRWQGGTDAWPGQAYAVWKIFVITPTSWIAFGGVYVDALAGLPPNYDYGGYVLFYRTNDAGKTWNLNQDAPTLSGLLSAGAFNQNFPPALPLQAFHPVPPYVVTTDVSANRRNLAVWNATDSMQLCVITPSIFLAAHVYFGFGAADAIQDFGLNYLWMDFGAAPPHTRFLSRMLRTTDGGNNWTEVALPTLIDTQISWPDSSLQAYVFRDLVYCGNGVVFGKVRGGTLDYYDGSQYSVYPNRADRDPLTWNLVRSTDYGATFTCVPKNGLPASCTGDARYIGKFTVVKKATANPAGGQNPATIVLTCWGGDGYYIYFSKDNGDSWNKGSLLAKSGYGIPMDGIYLQSSPDTVHLPLMPFRDLQFTGSATSPAPVSVATPWRFNSKIVWKPE